jgi:hypothetical protein
VRRRGAIVQTGLHTKPATLDGMALSEKDVSLIGSWCYLITDWPRIIRLIALRQVPGGQGGDGADPAARRRHTWLRRTDQSAR